MLESRVHVVITDAKFIGQLLVEDVRFAEHEILAEVFLGSIVAKTAAVEDRTEWRSIEAHLVPVAEAGIGRILGSDIPVDAGIPLEGIVAGRTSYHAVVVELPDRT